MNPCIEWQGYRDHTTPIWSCTGGMSLYLFDPVHHFIVERPWDDDIHRPVQTKEPD